MLVKLLSLVIVFLAARFIYLKLISPNSNSSKISKSKPQKGKYHPDDAEDADYKEVK